MLIEIRENLEPPRYRLPRERFSTPYGFRPTKSAHDAVDDIANTLWAGYTQVIDADLSKYFDSIPHAKLMAVVAERVVDGGILHLIKHWLKAPIIFEADNGVKRTVGGGKANRKGTPQGGVISPLLANCYLHILDRIWQRRCMKGKLSAHLVRYADDFVVMCRKDVEEPLKVVRHVLERLGLGLNEAKTISWTPLKQASTSWVSRFRCVEGQALESPTRMSDRRTNR